MKKLPAAENPLVIRTDFSNQGVWEEICAIIRQPVGEEDFLANVEFVDDAAYANASKKQLLSLFCAASHLILAAQRQPCHEVTIARSGQSEGGYRRLCRSMAAHNKAPLAAS